MKEKKVDICLAKAGFGQLIVIGSGGTLFTELFRQEEYDKWTMIAALLLFVPAMAVTFYEYRKASRLSKKTKGS